MTRKQFIVIFRNMPLAERNKTALNLTWNGINQPVSWNVAFCEVRGKTKLSKEILSKLNL